MKRLLTNFGHHLWRRLSLVRISNCILFKDDQRCEKVSDRIIQELWLDFPSSIYTNDSGEFLLLVEHFGKERLIQKFIAESYSFIVFASCELKSKINTKFERWSDAALRYNGCKILFCQPRRVNRDYRHDEWCAQWQTAPNWWWFYHKWWRTEIPASGLLG